jgi:hypothetical protein
MGGGSLCTSNLMVLAKQPADSLQCLLWRQFRYCLLATDGSFNSNGHQGLTYQCHLLVEMEEDEAIRFCTTSVLKFRCGSQPTLTIYGLLLVSMAVLSRGYPGGICT